jgi:glycosyltransferase involved in cell wall biosynthesis
VLVVIETHPVQYHAPVYRALQTVCGVPVTAIYGSDFSIAGYRDQEFGVSFAWDTELLASYEVHFLTRVRDGGPTSYDKVRPRGLGALLRRLRPRAVLLLGYASRFDWISCYEAWRGSFPLLFRAETTDYSTRGRALKAWTRQKVLRFMYRRFARILYIGQSSYRHYRRLGVPEGKLIFAPYCVETEPFVCGEDARSRLRGTTRAELGLGESDIIVLFSGKIIERKGPDLLLQAVKMLPESMRVRICLCFLGDGLLREPLQIEAMRAPVARTKFLGFQNQTQLSRFYHAADILVLPSRWGETWGLVVNEALHHGVPCIVSEAVGCAPDLIQVGVTGYTFETNNVQSLTLALQQAGNLIGNSEIRNKCRQKVSGYSVEAAAHGIARAYVQVTQ